MATKTAPVEVLNPMFTVVSKDWRFVKHHPMTPKMATRYGDFEPTSPMQLQYRSEYEFYSCLLCDPGREPPNTALVDADDLARFKTAFQTVVRRAEAAQTALARSRYAESRYAESRAIGEQLRQALLTLFQPPA